MPAPVWPVGLPQALNQDGFDTEPGDARREMKADNGGRRLDLEASSAPGVMSGMFHLSPAEWVLINQFFDDTLARGVLDFDFPDQIGAGGGPSRCRFIGRPKIQTVLGPDLFVVPVRFEVLP